MIAAKAFTLTTFNIVTGRRHQIRVHTAHVGHPTMSDGRYTADATFKAYLRNCSAACAEKSCLLG